MKPVLILTVVAALAAGCTSQQVPAEMALKGLDSAVAAARPELEKFAGTELTGVTDAVAAVRKKFDGGDFAGVIADAGGVTTKLEAAVKAAADKKLALTSEWTSFAGLPGMVSQITAKITELGAMRRLPAGMDATKLGGAKASLESVTTLWADASAAFSSGDLVAAVAKAKDVKPIVDGLMTTLGLSAS